VIEVGCYLQYDKHSQKHVGNNTKNMKQDHPVGVNRRVNLNITCMR